MDRSDDVIVGPAFAPDSAADCLSGDWDIGLNACFECCDRHAAVDADRPAIYFEDEGRSSVTTFGELRARSTAFAGLLTRLGVQPGDCVAALVPRSPELVVAALGAWRIGAIFMPLFTAFGEAAIGHRLQQANAAVLIVDEAYLSSVEGIDNRPPSILISNFGCSCSTTESWDQMVAAATLSEPIMLDREAPFLRMFTSGTTGKPKSLDVPLRALVAFAVYMREGIDLQQADRFWNLADPGWAYGLYYALIGPLLLGIPTVFSKQAFDPYLAIEIIRRLKITSLAGSPTAFRLLMKAGPDAVRPIRKQLRVVSSAGEPLTPEVSNWFREHLGVDVRDHYGQTELGIVLVSRTMPEDLASQPKGSTPISGFSLAVLDEAGGELGPGAVGELAVHRTASPLFWFAGYRERKALSDSYYRTGDLVQWNSEGGILFIGRTDDVITSSGYRIGPFDVESALAEHAKVLEVGVIGKTDVQRTEIVKAFVVLMPDVDATNDLIEELKQHVRKRLSAHAYPREIEFIDRLPRTPSGKLQRHVLKGVDNKRSQ
ncbi:MAG: AMP-binding protein [Sphingopyxis sp.]|uniref:AMP-binding protein n=1 Tax=Sphingopyxis sp. TaxID=1908224 RepID=UPI001A4751CC|nr:AMP-binding protein [Sphingopyxis sp.]MBL9071410.1 AMP-binding protein [Sphingopyxis sp.]